MAQASVLPMMMRCAVVKVLVIFLVGAEILEASYCAKVCCREKKVSKKMQWGYFITIDSLGGYIIYTQKVYQTK